MGRRTARKSGYTIRRLTSGTWQIRGTHEGAPRLEESLRTKDEGEAKRRAPEVWRQYIDDYESGRLASRADSSLKRDLETIGADWVEEKAEAHGTSAETLRSYLCNVTALARYFPTIGHVTERRIEEYHNLRMREVSRGTVKKEHDVLRNITRFAYRRRLILTMPEFPPVNRKAKGRKAKGTKSKAPEASVAEIEAILEKLPVEGARGKFRMRDFCILLWETALRPELWLRVDVTRHWQPGDQWLNITADIDKNRWARRVPLSKRAQEALGRCYDAAKACKRNPQGLMFPTERGTRMREIPCTLSDAHKNIARKVLGDERGGLWHTSGYRPNRQTVWENEGVNGKVVSPAQIRFLMGHRSAAMTGRYDRTNEEHVGGLFGVGTGNAALGTEAA